MDYIEPLGGATDDPYINRDPGTGTPGSKVPAQVFNDIQAELLNLIEAAGLTPDDGDLTQLAQAVAALSGFSISDQTEDTTPDVLADFLATYDASEAGNKKILLATLLTRFMGGRMSIASDANWNSVLTPGMYNTAGSAYTNAPLGGSAHPGCLWVVGRSQSTDHATQMFFYSATSPAIWTRTTVDGGSNWSAWKEVGSVPSGCAVSSAYAETSTQPTLSDNIPSDGTAPQNTEGTEILSVTVTTTKAGQKIRVSGKWWGQCSASTDGVNAAVFVNSEATPRVASHAWIQNTNRGGIFPEFAQFDAPGVGEHTIKLRVAAGSGNLYLNRNAATATLFGGTVGKSMLLAEVIEP